ERTYLNPEGDDSFHVGVMWRNSPARWIYGDASRQASMRADAEAPLFPVRMLERGGRGGRGERGERGGRGGRETQGRWLVRVTHPAGSVPAAVESARRRNLAVALVLLTLVAAAGAALVHNTRQANRLAA